MDRNIFEQKMKAYADLAINVGLNLQKGQRLLIRGPLLYGAPISAAPLILALTKSAYEAGARQVDIMWGDEQTELLRFQYAPKDSFEEFPEWKLNGPFEHAKRGDALISISGINPDLLKGQDAELVTKYTQTIQKGLSPFMKYVSTNKVNWLVISAPTPGWACKVLPELSSDEAVDQLWEIIFKLCRLDQADPISAWKVHTRKLQARAVYLNGKKYSEFRYSGPGTNLTIGFPEGATWFAASEKTSTGIPFIANIPTEEVFTLPHREKVDGVIHSSLPLNYSGTLIDDFSIEFKNGKVVKATAKSGEEVLQKLLATDDGASRLGEVALVPHNSPIAQSGVLFYNTLLDENAACHLAFGNAYQTTMSGGGSWSDEEFISRGGNASLVHVDFMVGSDQLDIDGVLPNGRVEPVLQKGEWSFSV